MRLLYKKYVTKIDSAKYMTVLFSFSLGNLYYPVHILTLWSIIHGYIFIILFVYDTCIEV